VSSEDVQADERQIRALLESRLAALRAKDASQFVAAFDASIVKFDLAPPLRETGPGVLDPAGLQWWLKEDRWQLEDHARAQLRAVLHGRLRAARAGPATMSNPSSSPPCYA
jgi:hypothetical protein